MKGEVGRVKGEGISVRPLKDIAELSLGKMLDDKKNLGQPRLYLANVNVRWGEFELSDLRTMRFQESELVRFGLESGDILMCEGGEPGRCATWKGQLHGMTFQKALHRIRSRGEVDQKYLFYRLFTLGRQGGFGPYLTGSTIKHLPKEKLELVEVAYPEFKVQKQIADLLSAYDDLIENNRRRIAILEALARNLYQEWFVRLRFPGHESTKIVDGVPEGWEVGSFGDYFQTSSGGTPSRKRPEYYVGEICWLKTQELGGNFIFDTDEHISTLALQESSAKLFPENTVIIAMYGATIGQTAILATASSTNQACCAIVPNEIFGIHAWTYLFWKQEQERLVSLSQGAAQNNVSQQIIKAFPTMMPKRSVLETFCLQVAPIFENKKVLERINQTLSRTRDLLLPRLMSGELEP